MGATPARIAALEKNIAQGSLMPLPSNVQLENKGCRLLGNTAEIVIHPIAGLGVHEDKIKKDPDLIKFIIRASLRSLQLLQSNPRETVKILMNWTGATEKDALRSLELAKPGFSKNGMLTDDDLGIEWNFIQQQTKKTNVPVSIGHDMTLLREALNDLNILNVRINLNQSGQGDITCAHWIFWRATRHTCPFSTSLRNPK